jgi:hypothetical protein
MAGSNATDAVNAETGASLAITHLLQTRSMEK